MANLIDGCPPYEVDSRQIDIRQRSPPERLVFFRPLMGKPPCDLTRLLIPGLAHAGLYRQLPHTGHESFALQMVFQVTELGQAKARYPPEPQRAMSVERGPCITPSQLGT